MAQHSTLSDHGVADDYFVVIPQSILFADISAGALRTYAVLRAHADHRSQHAWPSRKLLAAEVRCSIGSIDKYLSELAEIGALTIEPRYSEAGDRTSNLYIVRSRPRPGLDQGGPNIAPPPPKNDPTGGPKNDPTVAQKPVQELDPYELDPYEPHPAAPDGAEDPPLFPAGASSDFEQWWAVYPKKVDKKPAARAYRAARKRADAATLLAGAQAYATEVKGRDRSKIKHGATWLNGDCWENYADAGEADSEDDLPVEWRTPKPMPDDIREYFERTGDVL